MLPSFGGSSFFFRIANLLDTAFFAARCSNSGLFSREFLIVVIIIIILVLDLFNLVFAFFILFFFFAYLGVGLIRSKPLALGNERTSGEKAGKTCFGEQERSQVTALVPLLVFILSLLILLLLHIAAFFLAGRDVLLM